MILFASVFLSYLIVYYLFIFLVKYSVTNLNELKRIELARAIDSKSTVALIQSVSDEILANASRE